MTPLKTELARLKEIAQDTLTTLEAEHKIALLEALEYSIDTLEQTKEQGSINADGVFRYDLSATQREFMTSRLAKIEQLVCGDK